MPRENVYDADGMAPYGPQSSAQGVIEVSWSREAGHVQVATRLFNDDGKSFGIDGEIPTPPEELARREVWASGFYVSLDRNGINDLIRKLRKARNQAYGPDE